MASDAEILKELSAFLKINDVASSRVDTIIPTFWTVPNGIESESSLSTSADAAMARKRRIRREKEIIRKQRYHRRLKQERETCGKWRTARLLRTKGTKPLAQQIYDNAQQSRFNHVNWALKDSAVREREERLRAEQEQQRLVKAVCTQATYLASLKSLPPSGFATIIEGNN